MSAYKDDWEGQTWRDVVADFAGYSWSGENDDESRTAAIPEPEDVILASYVQEGYEGDAWVIYRNGDKFYEVTGSHCSC